MTSPTITNPEIRIANGSNPGELIVSMDLEAKNDLYRANLSLSASIEGSPDLTIDSAREQAIAHLKALLEHL